MPANLFTPPVKRLIDRFELQTLLVFKPSKTFYQSTGINRIRFGQLSKGKKNPESNEIKSLVEYFNQYFLVRAEDLL